MNFRSASARLFKWVGLGALALILILMLALLLLDWNTARPYLATWVSGHTGRDFSVGNIDVDLSLKPRFSLRDVKLDNAEWGRDEAMLTADSLDVRVDLPALLHGEVVLPSVRVDGARLLLERTPDGRNNWDFIPGPLAAPAVEPVLPEERPEIPRIGRLIASDIRVDYRSPAFEADLNLDRLQGRMRGGTEDVRLGGSGTLEGKPLDFTLRGGNLSTLRGPDEPYPISVNTSLGRMNFDARGSIRDPLGVRGLDLAITMDGADLSNLHPVIPLPLPPTPTYRFRTGLKRDGLVWILQDLAGAVGRTDIAGDLRVDLGGKRPTLRGSLSSDGVHLPDLRGILGIEPRRPDPRPDRLFPHQGFNMGPLQAADMQLDYRAGNVSGTALSVSNLAVDLSLQGGLLQMQLEHANFAEGTVSGNIRLQSGAEPPKAALDFRFSGARLSELVPQTPLLDASSGKISGHGEISGSGNSVAQMVGGADGLVEFAMSGGTLDNTIVEAIGLDVAELLLVLGEDGTPSPIRCVAGIVRVDDGIARPAPMIVDTRDSLIEVTGTVNLQSEALNLAIEAHAKDPTLFSAQGSVSLGGTIISPQVGVSAGPAVGQAIGAAALAALINPLAAIVPFIDPGTAEDAACGPLLRKAGE